MKDLAEKAGKSDRYHIESRATGNWEHGNPIHPGTQEIFRKYDIRFDENKGSQQISHDDFVKFDQIICMDDSNLSNLMKLSPKNQQHKIKKLLDISVPDPYHTGDFEETYELVKKGCQSLMSENLT